jgi:hypothetical protein
MVIWLSHLIAPKTVTHQIPQPVPIPPNCLQKKDNKNHPTIFLHIYPKVLLPIFKQKHIAPSPNLSPLLHAVRVEDVTAAQGLHLWLSFFLTGHPQLC